MFVILMAYIYYIVLIFAFYMLHIFPMKTSPPLPGL